MKAKLYANQMRIGGPASEFIREVEDSRHTSVKETDAPKKAGATKILESLHKNDENPNEIDLGIMTGEFLNRRLDNELTEFKVIPYFLTDEARSKGEGISKGSYVRISGDDRNFRVLRVLYEQEAVRLEDENHNEFVVPWSLIRQKRSSPDEAV